MRDEKNQYFIDVILRKIIDFSIFKKCARANSVILYNTETIIAVLNVLNTEYCFWNICSVNKAKIIKTKTNI